MDSETANMLQTLLYGVVTLSVVSTIYMLVSPLLEGDKLKSRMGSVANARDGMRKARMDEMARNEGLRKGNKAGVKKLVDDLSLEKLLEATDLRDKLAQAGLRGQRPMYTFYFARLVLPLVFLVLGLIFLVGLNIGGQEMIQRIGYTVLGVAFGYYAPAIYLKNKAGKRLKSIMPVFPDALDLLLICVESGMSVELAFGRVAGDTLRTMANENRHMRVLEAEKKAGALPAKLTVPMILFFLPVIFIVILTPAAMRIGSGF